MNTHAAPTPVVVAGAADQRVVVVLGPTSATLVPNSPVPALAAAGELCALLGPGRARAREHPRRADAFVVAGAADQRVVVVPSTESATLSPNSPAPASSLPVSFAPCWVQVVPERMNTHAAPTLPLSLGPPISACCRAFDGQRHAVAEVAFFAPLPAAGELFALLDERVDPQRVARTARVDAKQDPPGVQLQASCAARARARRWRSGRCSGARVGPRG